MVGSAQTLSFEPTAMLPEHFGEIVALDRLAESSFQNANGCSIVEMEVHLA